MNSEFIDNQNAEREDADLVYLFALDDHPDLELSAVIHNTLEELREQAHSFSAIHLSTGGSTGEAADSSNSLKMIPGKSLFHQKGLTRLATAGQLNRVNVKVYRTLALVAAMLALVSLGGLALLIILASQQSGKPPVEAATPLATVAPVPATEQVTNQVSFGFEETTLGDWSLSASLAQDYAISLDSKVSHNGQNSLLLAPLIPDPTGFGAIARQYDPANYLGKRVRLRAFIKTEAVNKWAGLIMRVDGSKNAVLNFDNMQNRPIVGTTNWKQYSVVLDVPANTTGLFIGVMMEGTGKVWLDDVTLEAVDTSINVTSESSGIMPVMHTQPVNLDFEYDATSNDWWVTGDQPQQYTFSRDTTLKQNGASSGLLKFTSSEVPKGFGSVVQSFSADEYLGKRVRLSAYVKTQGVKDWAGLWMRIDGEKYKVLGFDNMENRPIKGTTDWKKYEIVLDVPAESVTMNIGLLLTGEGQVWWDDVRLEVVDNSVPTTNLVNS